VIELPKRKLRANEPLHGRELGHTEPPARLARSVLWLLPHGAL